MAKVVIDTEECEGCESCVEICPEVFGFDEDTEKAYVIKAEVSKSPITNKKPIFLIK
ncbi:MAG: ferredoxin [Desulfobacterales bacterium]